MIESFKVKANLEKNTLLIQLRGYFMKSEIELAFFLARKECKRLKAGFKVVLDLDGMYTNKEVNKTLISKARKTFQTLGAGYVRSVGVMEHEPKMPIREMEYFAFDTVGYYPN